MTLPAYQPRGVATCVVATGPEPAQDWKSGDEYPVWYVGVQDDDGEDVGKVYTCSSREGAINLAMRMARDRRLEFINEAGYA